MEKVVEQLQIALDNQLASGSGSDVYDDEDGFAALGSQRQSRWKYEVFLSFRGEDTRKTFVDFLYDALVQRGIYTYKDDETLPRGQPIGPSLFKAIEESQIAIIVFSENYADSSWCLDELTHIMKCMEERGQIVLPIFYDVNPSDMRKRNWENTSKAETWRKALVDATSISGWVIDHIANGFQESTSCESSKADSNTLCGWSKGP